MFSKAAIGLIEGITIAALFGGMTGVLTACGGTEDDAVVESDLCIEGETIDFSRNCPFPGVPDFPPTAPPPQTPPPTMTPPPSGSGSVQQCETSQSSNGLTKTARCTKQSGGPSDCNCSINNVPVASCTDSGSALTCPGCCAAFF